MAHIAKYKATSVGHMLAHYRRDWSLFGREREQLRETLRSFDPSLPRLGAGKLRTGLESAQSSIQSLLDAQERREELERQLRSLETASGR